MTSAFRYNLQSWADQADIYRLEHVVRISIEKCGSVADAKVEARRITTGFSNMRSEVRKRAVKIAKGDGMGIVPHRTAYETIVCRAMAPGKEFLEVRFTPIEMLSGMYETYTIDKDGEKTAPETFVSLDELFAANPELVKAAQGAANKPEQVVGDLADFGDDMTLEQFQAGMEGKDK